MDKFNLREYISNNPLLKEVHSYKPTEEEIEHVKNIIKKNYDSLISQYVGDGYDEKELQIFYNHFLDPNSIEDMGKLEWIRDQTIEYKFQDDYPPISKMSDNQIIKKMNPTYTLRRKRGFTKSDEPSFIRTKTGLKRIFNQMLSGELSGNAANDEISDFTFGQGSMGVTDDNTLYLRQFGLGGGDFNDYVIGKFENGGFTPASQPNNKTALKIWNYLNK